MSVSRNTTGPWRQAYSPRNVVPWATAIPRVSASCVFPAVLGPCSTTIPPCGIIGSTRNIGCANVATCNVPVSKKVQGTLVLVGGDDQPVGAPIVFHRKVNMLVPLAVHKFEFQCYFFRRPFGGFRQNRAYEIERQRVVGGPPQVEGAALDEIGEGAAARRHVFRCRAGM